MQPSCADLPMPRGTRNRHGTTLPRRIGIAFALLIATTCSARAQPRQFVAGQRFNVDLVNTAIVGPNRVVSLAGAYTALGQGIDNAVITPVAYAARTLWDSRWFSLDLTVDLSPGLLRRIDFINSRKSNVVDDNSLFVTAGASAMFGSFGLGAILRTQRYRIGETATLDLLFGNFGACYAFLEGQLLVGMSARTSTISLSRQPDGRDLGSFTQIGPEVGAIVGPVDRPFRVGVAARTALKTSYRFESPSELPFASPEAVVLPAEVQIGFAYQFGDRPLNRRWVNPHERAEQIRRDVLRRRQERQERAAAWPVPLDASLAGVPAREPRLDPEPAPTEEQELEREVQRAERAEEAAIAALSRRYVLLSADLVLIGETARGVDLEAFLAQERQDAGRNPSFSVRVGVESELLANRFRVRVGSYLEPSRIAGLSPRLHGTLGGDVKVLTFDLFGLLAPLDWRVTAAFDFATEFQSFGFSLGIWH